jgi:hypothetical protein
MSDESEKILDQFAERAKFFGEILDNGDASDLVKMFKPVDSSLLSNITISFILFDEGKADNDIIKKDYQDYTFCIYNSNVVPPYFPEDTILLGYFKKDVKESKDAKYVVAGYVESSTTTNTWQSQLHFTKDSKLLDCEIEFSYQSPSTVVKWDSNGKLVTKKNMHLLTEKKVTIPELPRDVQEKLIKKDTINSSKTFFSFHPIKLPKISDQKVTSVFKRIEYLANMKRPRDLEQLLKWKLTEKRAGGSIHCVNGKVRDIVFSTLSHGYYLSISDDGKILAYAEGMLHDGEARKFEDFYKKRDDSRHYYRRLLNAFVALTKGVEVKFHPNGYPASYRTVVNDRLFGRQIEWNDKGEVLSDVDLDIPKVWKNAPKTNETNPK